MSPLLSILDYLRAQLGWVWSFRPPEPVDVYVPLEKDLNQASAAPFLTSYLPEVQARFAAAAADVVKLGQARTVAAAMRNPPAAQPIECLPKNAPKFYEDRLLLDVTQGSSKNSLGTELATGVTSPNAVADAVDALLQLRRADNVVIRVLAARHAETLTGSPVAEIMALFREEGNLDVPASSASLDNWVPTDAAAAPTSNGHYPVRGDNCVWPHLIWLAQNGGSFRDRIINYPVLPPSTEFELKEMAAVDWALHICGLDQVQGLYFTRKTTMTDSTLR